MCTEREHETVLYNKSLTSLLHDVSYGKLTVQNHSHLEENGMEKEKRLAKEEFGHDPAICLREEAILFFCESTKVSISHDI